MRRRIVRKKKENKAGEALSKIKGGKELEIAAVILKELAQRKQRKNDIENKTSNLKDIKEKEKRTKIPLNKELDENHKRIKELENLKKMGIIKVDEFEKLKKYLIN